MKTACGNPELMRRFRLLAPAGAPSECWLWQGRTDRAGEPRLMTDAGEDLRAQHVALEFATDVVFLPATPVGTSCGKRRCVNPAHLVVGQLQPSANAPRP